MEATLRLRSLYSSQLHKLRPRTIFTSSVIEPESPVYKKALMFQKPSTIQYQVGKPINSASFIGTIDLPLKRINKSRFGLHTMLSVKSSPNDSNHSSSRIMLKMWDQMAEMAEQHLKPRDFVYVWGPLESYIKADNTGKPRLYYEVVVKDINYIVLQGKSAAYQNYEASESAVSGEDDVDRRKERLYLWQVFFTSPQDWWDCRKRKRNPRYPDFRHKDTGEALWLNPKDPPWINRQLEIYDSRLGGQYLEDHVYPPSGITTLKYDDLTGI